VCSVCADIGLCIPESQKQCYLRDELIPYALPCLTYVCRSRHTEKHCNTCKKIMQAVSVKYSKCEAQESPVTRISCSDLNCYFLLVFQLSSSPLTSPSGSRHQAEKVPTAVISVTINLVEMSYFLQSLNYISCVLKQSYPHLWSASQAGNDKIQYSVHGSCTTDYCRK
jgi:hypothetical protein